MKTTTEKWLDEMQPGDIAGLHMAIGVFWLAMERDFNSLQRRIRLIVERVRELEEHQQKQRQEAA